ncbi:ras-like GTP-binding protein RhoL [Tribolium castaneum]|uniref:Rho-like protein n=1 Tax=Tribolium castaneum TaxID=7070 RepID=D6WKP8_TRICA|nr:PREDICTED: ras-like GTP-binding protein RhoL [Tribolium castaneum]XP_008200456.1 PREDICTED: ras-like GTP-binding protein RhoL [Tribolium castaneum]XP_015835314.1 PREDICTED: ras-like GTP-binding protein RhoL [Tribolium castaneum]XP_972202.1 PREDICTED: ras-like GTP-binding protein RhoL [Tribolium castaneum]EFA04536.1 Rho-like protein [Tribolium castaneum]|eukprot:XP_008200455.1 PREDICTED: ras-like GTP-binding protein RhoL [Tribolium castaneum]
MTTPSREENGPPGENVKVTVVGDGVVGKTCLLISYTKDEFPEEYVPTVFEHYGQDITVDDVKYNMTLWDTAGQEDYERLRPLAYPNTKCFLVCFSVDASIPSYENVIIKWVPEVRHHNPHTPIVLVATKIDLRDDPSVHCYSTQDGKKLKRKVKAEGYVECSAKTREGLKEVFEEAIRAYKKTKIKARQVNCALL